MLDGRRRRAGLGHVRQRRRDAERRCNDDGLRWDVARSIAAARLRRPARLGLVRRLARQHRGARVDGVHQPTVGLGRRAFESTRSPGCVCGAEKSWMQDSQPPSTPAVADADGALEGPGAGTSASSSDGAASATTMSSRNARRAAEPVSGSQEPPAGNGRSGPFPVGTASGICRPAPARRPEGGFSGLTSAPVRGSLGLGGRRRGTGALLAERRLAGRGRPGAAAGLRHSRRCSLASGPAAARGSRRTGPVVRRAARAARSPRTARRADRRTRPTSPRASAREAPPARPAACSCSRPSALRVAATLGGLGR